MVQRLTDAESLLRDLHSHVPLAQQLGFALIEHALDLHLGLEAGGREHPALLEFVQHVKIHDQRIHALVRLDSRRRDRVHQVQPGAVEVAIEALAVLVVKCQHRTAEQGVELATMFRIAAVRKVLSELRPTSELPSGFDTKPDQRLCRNQSNIISNRIKSTTPNAHQRCRLCLLRSCHTGTTRRN